MLKYLLLLALAGCATTGEEATVRLPRDGPELKVRAVMPLCMQDCKIEISNTEENHEKEVCEPESPRTSCGG